MPQDIPLEASETLAFTPECLAEIEAPPVFHLRAATPRDKRFHRRLRREEGMVFHSSEDQRAELLRGLEQLWSPDAFEAHVPRLRAYWQASDDFDLQRKDEPELVWSYDAEEERAVGELVARVRDAWPPLRRMEADNAEFGELSVILMGAVVIENWTGLDVERRIDRGFLTVDCATAVFDEIEELAETHNIPRSLASAQLFNACATRMGLIEEEEKNSASPSPSSEPPQSSGTDSDLGKSPASAPSKKTRKAA